MTDKSWAEAIKHEYRATLDLQGFPIQLTLSREGNTVELVARSPGMPEDDFYFSMDLGFAGPNDTLWRLITFLKLAHAEGVDAIRRQGTDHLRMPTDEPPVEFVKLQPLG